MSLEIFAVNISAQLNQPVDDWLKFFCRKVSVTNFIKCNNFLSCVEYSKIFFGMDFSEIF